MLPYGISGSAAASTASATTATITAATGFDVEWTNEYIQHDDHHLVWMKGCIARAIRRIVTGFVPFAIQCSPL
jgi:hypothetical protein